VIAAVLTPPDVISQVALALPLLAFYEISILIGSRIEKNREAEDKKAEEAEARSDS
jgi:sec-independent protein translocase protein TatC